MDGVRCPSTSIEIQRRSETLRCSTNSPYHCLRNEKGQLMEKCMEISWIQSGYCAEYNVNAMKVDAKPCDRNRGICPDKTYFSSKVIAYSACVQPLNTLKPSVVPGQSSTTTDLASDRGNENLAISLLPLWIILPLLFLSLSIIAGGFIYIRRRKHKRKDSRKVDTGESTELIQGSSAPKKEDGAKSKIPEEQSKMKIHIHEQRLRLNFFDNSHYTELTVTQTLREWIKSGYSVFIVGNPGSGKTSLAWNTCVEIHNTSAEDTGYQILTFTNFDDIPTDFDAEIKMLLLLDDCFEIWNYFPSKVVPYLKRLNDDLEMKIKRGAIQLIITISSFVFEYLQLHFHVKNFTLYKLLHLSDMNRPDALDIKNMCMAYQIEVNDPRNIKYYEGIIKKLKSLKSGIIGAPLSLYIFARQMKARDFFSDPLKYVIKDVNDLKKSEYSSDNSMYCTLIYAMLQGGIINMTEYDAQLLRKIGEISNISHPTLNVDHYLLRQREEGQYEFIHESILRLLFKCFGNRCPKFLLVNCDPKTIVRYLRTPNDPKWTDDYRKDGLLIIENDEVLTLLADQAKKHDIELTGHVILRDEGFRKRCSSICFE